MAFSRHLARCGLLVACTTFLVWLGDAQLLRSSSASVSDECATEVSKRLAGTGLGDCCKDYLKCDCIQKLCKTADFTHTDPCLGDHLHKQLCEGQNFNCPMIEKCKKLSEAGKWGTTAGTEVPSQPAKKSSKVVIYAISAVLCLVIVLALGWVIIWCVFFAHRKRFSKTRSRSRSKSKTKTKSRESRKTRGTRRTRTPKSKLNRDKSNTKRRGHERTASFNSRVVVTQKISKVGGRGRAAKSRTLSYTKLKKALAPRV